MSGSTKQRLVGALVLACLAVIFLPMLLDGSGVPEPEIRATIPPMPEPPQLADMEPQRPALSERLPGAVEEAEVLGELPLSPDQADSLVSGEAQALASGEQSLAEPALQEAPEPESITEASPPAEQGQSAPDQPRLDASGLPEGWVVRLGSFGQRANAETLLNRLLRTGHPAFIDTVASGDNVLQGVFVGPVLTRAEADGLRRSLQQEFDLEGLVLRFSGPANGG